MWSKVFALQVFEHLLDEGSLAEPTRTYHQQVDMDRLLLGWYL